MNKYKIGQKIWHVEIKKYKNEPSKYSVNQNGIFIEEMSILGVSKYKICLNNSWFTTLDNEDREGYRKDRKYNKYIDDISVNVRTRDSILGGGVFADVYSTKKPTKNLSEKMYGAISAEIKKEFGFLANGDDIWKMIKNYEIKI